MRADVVWVAVGMGAAFLIAAVVSVALGGPAWPYFLGLGILALAVAFVVGLRQPTRAESG